MMRFLLLLLGVLFLVSCKPGVPKDIIQPDEMENVLFDIHLVDGYVSTIPTADSAKKVSAPIYKGIFKKYGIDSAMQAKSMSYYYKHPDLLSKMYDRISQRMAKARDTEVQKQQKEEKLKIEKAAKERKAAETKKADSLKKLQKTKQKDSSGKANLPLRKTTNAAVNATRK